MKINKSNEDIIFFPLSLNNIYIYLKTSMQLNIILKVKSIKVFKAFVLMNPLQLFKSTGYLNIHLSQI